MQLLSVSGMNMSSWDVGCGTGWSRLAARSSSEPVLASSVVPTPRDADDRRRGTLVLQLVGQPLRVHGKYVVWTSFPLSRLHLNYVPTKAEDNGILQRNQDLRDLQKVESRTAILWMVHIPVNSVNGLSLGFCGGSDVGRAVSAVRQPAPWCSRQPPGVFFCWPRATAQLFVSYSMSSLCADNEPILFTVSL